MARHAFCTVRSIAVLIALTLSTVCAAVSESTFAFAEVRSSANGESKRFCVNHQQFYKNKLPTSVEKAEAIPIKWLTTAGPVETDICPNHAAREFTESVVTPIRYVTSMNASVKNCLGQFNNTSFMNVEMAHLDKLGVSNVLLLVEKGKPVEVVPTIHKYLFAQFYNPEASAAKPDAFYMYYDTFFDEVLPMAQSSANSSDPELTISFYRPKSWPFDGSEVIILVIAVFCIAVGSIWGAATLDDAQRKALEVTSEESTVENGDLTPTDPSDESTLTAPKPSSSSNEPPPPTFVQQVIGVVIAVALIVCILLLAFFFRDVSVWFFNIFIVIAGTFSIWKCVSALLCFEDPKILSVGLLCCRLFDRKLSCLRTRFGPASLMILLGSLTICLVWFFVRQMYYAFWLLDFINICVCIAAIQAAQLRTLRILTMLLIGMFCYDIFMVFGTKLLTPNGCSVMIQVVTGEDCNAKPTDGAVYPVAPIEMANPERMPLLFYIPIVSDVMSACYDINVEREYRHIMLGLGDVIVPGYLIAYAFVVDKMRPTRLPYGVIALVGYALGLITTFVALRFMSMGQPALIYLVPFTLIPLIITSWLRGHLSEIWYGKFYVN
uniref:Signal peptide peptidase-like 2B n=1 Tax=Panagrellus redivivus TaxID=6233 RepID=A0A7E4VJI1_PANRE